MEYLPGGRYAEETIIQHEGAVQVGDAANDPSIAVEVSRREWAAAQR